MGPIGPYLFGTLVAVIAAIYFIEQQSGDAEGGDAGSTLDKLGDAFVVLTSTEEERLSQLQPEVEQQARAALADLQSQGMTVEVGNTLRTKAQEKDAIASGHSAVKTHSWHELGRALDVYPYDPDTGQPDLKGKRFDLFVQMQQTFAKYGFSNIGYTADWQKHYINGTKGPIWDGGHVEYKGPYATIAEAVAAEGATYGIA